MIKKKPYDGVVVAAHYNLQGQVEWVRAFERRGFVFHDRVKMDRKTLVDHLRDGKNFKTGIRILGHGNDFNVHEDLHLIERGDEEQNCYIVAGEGSPSRDSLGDLPII